MTRVGFIPLPTATFSVLSSVCKAEAADTAGTADTCSRLRERRQECSPLLLSQGSPSVCMAVWAFWLFIIFPFLFHSGLCKAEVMLYCFQKWLQVGSMNSIKAAPWLAGAFAC